MLAQLVALAEQTLGRLGFVGTLVQELLSAQQWGQLFADLQTLLDGINQIIAGGNDLDTQIATLTADVATLSDLVTSAENALLAAVGTPMQAGAPITLPSDTGSAGDDIANRVWDFIQAGESRSQGYYQVVAGGLALNLGEGPQAEIRSGFAGGWSVYGNWDNTNATTPSMFGLPPLDYSTVEATDATQYDWYFRVYGDSWPLPNSSRGDNLQFDNGNGNFFFIITMTDTEFKAMQKARFGSEVAGAGAPIWPGITGVTLLSAVAFSDSFTVDGPMQGVLLAITGAPTKQGTFQFDGLTSYRNAGAVAFLTDDGEAELSQPLGFTTAVYLPRSMVAAASVKVRVSPGIEGTCTPFSIP